MRIYFKLFNCQNSLNLTISVEERSSRAPYKVATETLIAVDKQSVVHGLSRSLTDIEGSHTLTAIEIVTLSTAFAVSSNGGVKGGPNSVCQNRPKIKLWSL